MRSSNRCLIIVAGPSGVGKSTFVEKICREFPQIVDIVTYTTRAMRKSESEGNPYHFVSREKFESLISEGFFIEWASVHNNMYGTPKDQIETALNDKKIVIMDIDVKGANVFRTKYPGCMTMFILPPSIDELRQRVLKRGPVDAAELELRLENARREIAEATQFDVQLVNADFNGSYAQFKKVVEEIVKNR